MLLVLTKTTRNLTFGTMSVLVVLVTIGKDVIIPFFMTWSCSNLIQSFLWSYKRGLYSLMQWCWQNHCRFRHYYLGQIPMIKLRVLRANVKVIHIGTGSYYLE